VAPLVLNHHERWDGKGYPSGIAGEAIPIGARILTIVDYYDAVTSERPYHNALSRESAVNLIKHEAGRALDPTLVEKFVAMLPELVAACEAARPVTGGSRRSMRRFAGAIGGRRQPRDGVRNIGLAHREIYALYEIAQSMGTSLGVSEHDGRSSRPS